MKLLFISKRNEERQFVVNLDQVRLAGKDGDELTFWFGGTEGNWRSFDLNDYTVEILGEDEEWSVCRDWIKSVKEREAEKKEVKKNRSPLMGPSM